MPASRRTLPAVLLVATMVLALIGAVLVARRLIADLPDPPAAETAGASVTVSGPPEDRTPEIRGRIVDADGNAVNDAAVRLVSPGAPYTVYADIRSDPAGAFSFAHVASQPLRVVADHDPEGAVTSAPIVVAPGHSTPITLVLSAASAVRGTVVDADDHPVNGASVYVEGVPWMARPGTSDADGAFRLGLVPDGVTFLVAMAGGYQTARVPLPRREEQVDRIVRIKLASTFAVDGDVRDADGSAGEGAIEGVVVDDRAAAVTSFSVGVESFTGAQGRSIHSAAPSKVEDPNGAFRLEHLAPGRYVLSAGVSGKAPTRSDPVDVSGGSTTRGVRIVLSPGGVVTGHVIDEHQAPVEGVELRFDAVSSVIDVSAAARTDAAGQYRLEGAPEGPFTLRAQKEGFRVRLLSGLRVDARATLVADVTLTAMDGGPGLELAGVGANLTATAEGIVFAAVFEGNPADKAGLRAGDRVIEIDGESTEGMSLADALQRLRGEVGTSVGVSVFRPKTGETVDVTVTRAAVVH